MSALKAGLLLTTWRNSVKKICQIFPSLAVLTQMRDYHGCRKRKLILLEAETKTQTPPKAQKRG